MTIKGDERYKNLKLWRNGGVCELYFAWDCLAHKRVILKTMLDEFVVRAQKTGRFQEMEERFEREAQIGALLPKSECSHIVPVTDYREMDGRRFLVMDFIEGSSLDDAIDRMDIKEALAVAIQLSNAVAEIHKTGLAHGDISADNAILDLNGKVWLVDFGLARVFKNGLIPQADNEQPVVGKKYYTAPEIFLNGAFISESTDVYSLGVTIVYLFCKEYLEMGQKLFEIENVHLMPAGLRKIVESCFSMKPSDRPTAMDVAAIAARTWKTEYPRQDPELELAAFSQRNNVVKTLVLDEGGTHLEYFSKDAKTTDDHPSNCMGDECNVENEVRRTDEERKSYRAWRRRQALIVLTGIFAMALLLVNLESNDSPVISTPDWNEAFDGEKLKQPHNAQGSNALEPAWDGSPAMPMGWLYEQGMWEAQKGNVLDAALDFMLAGVPMNDEYYASLIKKAHDP